MDFQIALSPDLDIGANEFISAWNDEPNCKEAARAELAESSAASFMEPGTAMAFLGGVAVTLRARWR